jgi:nicotinamide-nucleotide amidase
MTAGEPLAAIPRVIEEQRRAVLARAVERDVAIVTAESCTGGSLASLLIDIEGSSRPFERGLWSTLRKRSASWCASRRR